MTESNTIAISLGSSCSCAEQLKRIDVNNIHYFFDFIWNEYDGLKTVNEIIKNNFIYFNHIKNYTKTSSHPILKNGIYNINKYYPNFVFLHQDTTNPESIKSIIRKIKRTRNVLNNNKNKFFIYCRHYHNDLLKYTDLNILINESLNFCKIYQAKYNENFCLLSLISYDENINMDVINNEISILRKNENKNLKFDYIYRFDKKNLNKLFIKRWDIIFKKYNIK